MQIINLKDIAVEEAVLQARDVILAGEIVLYPTDTLYGLAVDATNKVAVEKLNQLKGRGSEKFTSVVVSDKKEISRFAEVPQDAQRLIDQFLPGPLTIALREKGDRLAHLASDGTVRFRIPDDDFVSKLSASVNLPFTSTSANVTGEPALPKVLDILNQFGQKSDEISLAIDDGPREGGLPSTVVRVVEGAPEIVREGVLSREDLGI